MENFDEIRVTQNFGKSEVIRVPHAMSGPGGGDERLKDKYLKTLIWLILIVNPQVAGTGRSLF